MNDLSSFNNFINESVKNIKPFISDKIYKMDALVYKYTKIVLDKLLSQLDDFKYSTLNLKNIFFLDFTKMLLTLDTDLYKDFLVELNEIIERSRFISIGGDYKSKNDVCNTLKYGDKSIIHRPLSSVSFKILPEINMQMDIFLYGSVYSSIPLMKVFPSVLLESSMKNNDDGDFLETFNNPEIKLSSLQSPTGFNFDIGSLSAMIDVNTILSTLFSFKLNVDNIDFKSDSAIEKLKSISDGLNVPYNIYNNRKNRILYIEEYIEKLYYNLTVTYLATLSKLDETSTDVSNAIINDIMVSSKNLLTKSLGFDGEDMDPPSEGAVLRNMSISLGSILNTLSKDFKSNCKMKMLFRDMLLYLISAKYETYNYSLVPYNNFKHKKLVSINKLANKKVNYLSTDIRTELQIIDNKFKSRNIIKNTDNTIYTFNKRIYSSVKNLIDNIGKYLSIEDKMKKSMGSDLIDSTLDNINKNFKSYRTYLGAAMNSVKTSLARASGLVISLLYEQSYVSGNYADRNAKYLSDIIYGITSDNDIFSYLENRFSELSIDDFMKRVNDILELYKYLHRKQTNIEMEISLTKTNICLNWLKVTKYIIPNIFDDKSRSIELFIIGEGGYNSYKEFLEHLTEITNERDQLNLLKNDVITDDDVSRNSKYFRNKYIIDEILFNKQSLESLDNSVDELKKNLEKTSSENLFGMFSDFGGMPLAKEVSDVEASIFNNRLVNPSIMKRPEYAESLEMFENIKRKYDSLLEKFFY